MIKYRSDIDGLRGLAILFVVLFHYFPKPFRGGFIGVDIFFIISGFLITSIIVEKESFSFRDFYYRRIKRIFPALIVVMASCFLFGWLFLLDSEFKALGKHSAAGAFFVSNIVLLTESGYFDADAITKPLMHFWSLAVEEQFYIFWPLLLFFTRNKILIILLTCASFICCLWLFKISQSQAFFLPHARFWELLIGALLVILKTKSNKNLSALGLVLLLVGLFCIKSKNFPGFYTLIPTLAAVLIIISEKSWVNQKILSNKFLVKIGLISYPLYLWHWPLISFAHILLPHEVSIEIRLSLVILALILSEITFRVVEQPIRFGNVFGKYKAFCLTLILILLGTFGIIIYKGDFIRDQKRYDFEKYFSVEGSVGKSPYLQEVSKLNVFRSECNSQKQSAIGFSKIPREISPSCYTPIANKKILFLWGDSHAQHLSYGLEKNLPKDWQILIVASSGCRVAIEPKNSDTDYCKRSNFIAFSKIQEIEPDTVIIAQSAEHDYNNFMKIKNALKTKKVLFLGLTPHWQKNLPSIFARNLWQQNVERTTVGIDENVANRNKDLAKEFLGDESFINIMNLFCNQEGCLVRIGEGDIKQAITSPDKGHLTPIASDILAKELLVKKITE